MSLKLLSAGAVKRGVAEVAAAYERASGNPVAVEFTQVHRIKTRFAAGESADVLVLTDKAMDDFVSRGIAVAATRGLVGRSRVGVVVHKDAPPPDVSDVEAFKRALLAASHVVHNDASSGVYIAELLVKLGLKDKLGDRIIVTNSGAAINTVVAEKGTKAGSTNGAADAIGMGQISEIMVMIAKGCPVKLVAPLPDAIQNISTYYAAAVADSAAPDAAAALARDLTSDAAKTIFAASGID